MNFRIGFGYDVHPLQNGTGLILGGIKIEYNKSAVGHSDADVLIHAICDALLGAANLGDIGNHFPSNDQQYKDIDSKLLLKEVHSLLITKNYSIGNLDTTVVLQSPKIIEYIPQMKKVLSDVLEMDKEDISIKATTTEHLGFVGREEGISAYASVLIYR